MKIIPCMLDISNRLVIDNIPISKRIADLAKEHLWAERAQTGIDTVVIHYISAANLDWKRRFDVEYVLRIFCDLAVSSHYLIARNGSLYHLVPENKKAWHCGGSIMPPPDNRQGVNEFSLGIELIATIDSGFTQKQYASLKSLCIDIDNRHHKKMTRLGHQDIAGQRAMDLGLRSDIKIDPGPLFNWSIFTTP